MQRIRSILLVSAVSLSYSFSLLAQDSTKIHFKVGAYYITKINYYGRTDSLQSGGFIPLAELWLGERFYLNAAPVFVRNASAALSYAGTVGTAGYQFTSSNKKWFGNFYAIKPFYKGDVHLVQSALKAQGAFAITSLNNIVNLTGGADIKVSDKIDFGVSGRIDHIFRQQLPGNTILVLDPSAGIFAGTQQFTDSYYKRTGLLILPEIEQMRSAEVRKFSVLSYELSIPVILVKNKWQVLFTPAYVLPENLVEIEGRPDVSEKGKKMFYATVGAKLVL